MILLAETLATNGDAPRYVENPLPKRRKAIGCVQEAVFALDANITSPPWLLAATRPPNIRWPFLYCSVNRKCL